LAFIPDNKDMRRMKQTGLNFLVLIVLVFLLKPSGVHGQQYRMELGLLDGTTFYMGDANSDALFRNRHPAFGLLARYNLNDRFAFKANALLSRLSGTTMGAEATFLNGEVMSFNNRILDAGVQLEMNFYSYGAPDYKPGSSRISPYLLLGLGFTGYQAEKRKV
jgi:hypothetical protein